MKSIIMFSLLLIILPVCLSFAETMHPVKVVPRPQFRTHILAFEDNVLFDTPAEGSLIYRTEGTGKIIRHTAYPDRYIDLSGGSVSYIHPAQYDRPALKLKLDIQSGEPGIAICHNGINDTSGKRNSSPGLEIVLREKDTLVRDLLTGQHLASIPEAFPRGQRADIQIAWDFDKRLIRIDMPKRSYQLPLPESVKAKGGFALRTPAKPVTAFRVYKIQVLWEGNRDLVLYDGYNTVYDTSGKQIGQLPPAALPSYATTYATTAIDLKKERSLIVLGGSDFSVMPETFKAWAVRDLKTGKLDILEVGSTVNGCIPFQGGGSMDGFWILQSWNPPASTCWVDWNAYDRGDRKGFIVPAMTGEKRDPAFIGFHDPSNALDGSIARYLRITESWKGVNHFTVHPNLLPFVTFTDVAMPDPTHAKVSHTGPAGMPTQLVVRDRDRAWYEQWAYLGNMLHSQNRGYNLFTRRDDWEGKMCPVENGVKPYEDYANMAPSLTEPGRLTAPMYRFNPDNKECTPLGMCWLRWAGGPYVVERKLPLNPATAPFQMLMDRSTLK